MVFRVETPGDSHEEAVSFMCMPGVERFTMKTEWDAGLGVYMLTEYQFAGDTEGHGRTPGLR